MRICREAYHATEPVGHPSSLFPLRNPCCTFPNMTIGNGGWGPSSGPQTSGRVFRNDSVLKDALAVSESSLMLNIRNADEVS